MLDLFDSLSAMSHHAASHLHPLPVIPLPADNTFSTEPHVLVSKLYFPLLSNAWRHWIPCHRNQHQVLRLISHVVLTLL